MSRVGAPNPHVAQESTILTFLMPSKKDILFKGATVVSFKNVCFISFSCGHLYISQNDRNLLTGILNGKENVIK